MAKRMVNDAEKVNDLTEYMRQENNKTIIVHFFLNNFTVE